MGVNLSPNSFNELKFIKYEQVFTCQLYLYQMDYLFLKKEFKSFSNKLKQRKFPIRDLAEIDTKKSSSG